MTVVTPKFEVWKCPKFDFETVSIAVGSWYTKFDFGRIKKIKNKVESVWLVNCLFVCLLKICCKSQARADKKTHVYFMQIYLLWRLTFNVDSKILIYKISLEIFLCKKRTKIKIFYIFQKSCVIIFLKLLIYRCPKSTN